MDWGTVGAIAGAVTAVLGAIGAVAGHLNKLVARGKRRDDPAETAKQRIKELQRLVGLRGGRVDGMFGPRTREACNAHWVGSRQHVAQSMRARLRGNGSAALVVWIQQQLNRKYSAGLAEDGIPGRAFHRAVVDHVERDGIVGPRGYKKLCS